MRWREDHVSSKNTTSLIQPLDHGLIRWFKHLYWQLAEERCMAETKGAEQNQLQWFAGMKPRVAFEILQKVTHHLNGPDGKHVAMQCWNSALGVDESIDQEKYTKSLEKRLPGPKTLQDLLLTPEAVEPLKQLEQMSSFWIDKLKNRPMSADDPMADDPSLPQIQPEKLAELEELLELYGKCPAVQRAMKEALEVGQPTSDIV